MGFVCRETVELSRFWSEKTIGFSNRVDKVNSHRKRINELTGFQRWTNARANHGIVSRMRLVYRLHGKFYLRYLREHGKIKNK